MVKKVVSIEKNWYNPAVAVWYYYNNILYGHGDTRWKRSRIVEQKTRLISKTWQVKESQPE